MMAPNRRYELSTEFRTPSVTPIQGLCFRSAHNPFWLFDLHF